MTDPEKTKPSKTQLKKEAEQLQDLGSSLVKLPQSVLNKFNIPEEIYSAIKQAQLIKQNGALKRQLQFIGKLMRNHDTENIQKMYQDYSFSKIKINRHFHLCEKWRDKFLENNKSVFNDFVEQYPDVNRQRLHQLQRQSVSEKQLNKPPKSARLLFNFIKETLEN